MLALVVLPIYPLFTGADGKPLDAGYIWIGAANLDPQTNPVTVYWDAALTQPAAQPIRTLAGYPSNNGTPSRIYVNTDYSIRVMDNKSVVVHASLNNNLYTDGFGSSNATGNGLQQIFPVLSVPSAIFINGVYQNQNSYTLASGNVTFSEAPPFRATIEFIF